MQHLSDGLLRRMVDDPIVVPIGARQHYHACPQCQSRFDLIAADAQHAARLLTPSLAGVDTAAALAVIRHRLASGGTTSGSRFRLWKGLRLPDRRPFAALVAACILAASMLLTPVGSLAQSFLTIFEPEQFSAVSLTTQDLAELRQLPNLTAYGSMHGLGSLRPHVVANRQAAENESSMLVGVPRYLPTDVPRSIRYTVVSKSSASFTFSAARAQAALATKSNHIPPMPNHLDGSTLQATIGPIVVLTYGQDKGAGIPDLVIVQAVRPTVSSTGATVSEIEDYLLRLPGVSPSLAAQIRAIGDPNTTLPIPIPVNLASAHVVRVHGARGLAVGDNTGVGSGIIWESHGMVYGVAGLLPESQVVAVADSLPFGMVRSVGMP